MRYAPLSFHNSSQPLFGKQFSQLFLPDQTLIKKEGEKNQLTAENSPQKIWKTKGKVIYVRDNLPWLDFNCQFIVATPKKITLSWEMSEEN